MSNQFSNGYALLIAVDDNAVQDYALPDVKKDVEALYRVLIDLEHCAYPKDNVTVLGGTGSTRQNILDGLEWLQAQVQQDTSGNATAVVYYTGHGWRDEEAEPDQFFFIPYDMRRGKLRSSALRSEDFAEAVSDVQPQRLMVVLDCCHAAGMGVKSVGEIPMGYSGVSFKPEELMTGEKDIFASGAKGLEQLTKGHGRAVLSSSTGDQSSYIRKDGKMSVFTYHLVEALTGHAQPEEGDNEVLVSDVMGHVYRHVPQSVKDDWKEEQVPDYQVSGNFPIALLQGGKSWSKEVQAPDPLEISVPSKGDERTSIYSGGGAVVFGGVDISDSGTFIGRDQTIESEDITVGNISDSTGVAIGRGASADVDIGTGVDVDEITKKFEEILQTIEKRPDDPDVGKEELTETVQKIQVESTKGEEANPKKVERWLRNLVQMAPDIFEVVAAALTSPAAGIAAVIRNVAEKAKEEAELT